MNHQQDYEAPQPISTPIPTPIPPHIVKKYPSDQAPSPTIPPLQQPSAPSPPPSVSGGNGMIYCSGPQAPGYNVSTGKCTPIATSTNAIVPQQTQPQALELSHLPYTGDTVTDMLGSAMLYIVVVAFSALAIYRILQFKGWV